MMAMHDAKEGSFMFAEWISSLRREPPVADPLPDLSPLDPAAVQALAAGVQQLCAVCEELVTLAARSDHAPDSPAQRLLLALPEQIEAVRACASEINYHGTLCTSPAADSYSLAALGQWVWNE